MGKDKDPGAAARLVADRLVAYREAQGLSRQELAAQMDVHPTRVARIERAVDPPNLDTLARVAALVDEEITISVCPRGAKPEHLRKKVRAGAVRFTLHDARVTLVAG